MKLLYPLITPSRSWPPQYQNHPFSRSSSIRPYSYRSHDNALGTGSWVKRGSEKAMVWANRTPLTSGMIGEELTFGSLLAATLRKVGRSTECWLAIGDTYKAFVAYPTIWGDATLSTMLMLLSMSSCAIGMDDLASRLTTYSSCSSTTNVAS